MTLRLWKFSDFCSRHTVGVTGDDIMFHFLVLYAYTYTWTSLTWMLWLYIMYHSSACKYKLLYSSIPCPLYSLSCLTSSLGLITYYMLLCCITMNNQAGIHSATRRPIPLLVFYSQFMNLMEFFFPQSDHDKASPSNFCACHGNYQYTIFCRDLMPIGWTKFVSAMALWPNQNYVNYNILIYQSVSI